MTKVIDLHIEEKVYQSKKTRLSILNNFNLTVHEGESLSIVGDSGVGKSSLLNIIGLIDDNFTGEYSLFGSSVPSLSEKEKAMLRNQNLGFVLQESSLIDSLSMKDNITLPFLYSKHPNPKQFSSIFEELVDELGIRNILEKKPVECSGGERSRTVFARGIIMQPSIILSDEPTASLDIKNRDKMIGLLLERNQKYGTTLITVTHDLEVAKRHDRIVQLA